MELRWILVATKGQTGCSSFLRTRRWQRQPNAAAATMTRRGWTDGDGGELRVDAVGGAPACYGGGEAVDGDGDDLAMLMKEMATDGDD
uniref:DUF834 domain-containing protein n=1 Tax=Oryza meridionalis TaxID=40149 RepID=A0A0E0EQ22_9ORYZ